MYICDFCLMDRVRSEYILTHGYYFKDKGGFDAIKYHQKICGDCGKDEQCVSRIDLEKKEGKKP